MLWLIPVWMLLWIGCAGWGAALYALAFRVGGSSFGVVPSPRRLVWLGLAILLLVLQLASLVMPMRPWLLGVLLLGSLLGWPTLGRLGRNAWRTRETDGAWLGLVRGLAIAVVLLVLANSALQPTTWYDTVSTHIQQVKWAAAYPAVLGLGNLHPKLGFDQAHLLLAAALDGGPLARHTTHVVVPFFAATLVGDFLWSFLSGARAANARLERAFMAFTLPCILAKAFSDEMSSLSGDLTMAVVFLAALRELLAVGVGLRDRRRLGFPLLVFGALAGALFAIKFSALPVLVAAIGIFGWTAWRRQLTGRGVVLVAVLPCLLVLATIVRRIVLTGWPLYPIPVIELHLSWAVTRAEVLHQYVWIKSWARLPYHSLSDALDRGFWHWFVPWFESFRATREWTLTVVGFVALVARLVSDERREGRFRSSRVALVVAVACLVFWFVGAPDRRFGTVFLWALFALSLAPQLAARDRGVLLLVASLTLTWWNEGFAFHLQGTARLPLDPARETLAQGFTNPDGSMFRVNVPSDHDLCGDAPLPCSPFFTKQRMRDVTSLARGFLPQP